MSSQSYRRSFNEDSGSRRPYSNLGIARSGRRQDEVVGREAADRAFTYDLWRRDRHERGVIDSFSRARLTNQTPRHSACQIKTEHPDRDCGAVLNGVSLFVPEESPNEARSGHENSVTAENPSSPSIGSHRDTNPPHAPTQTGSSDAVIRPRGLSDALVPSRPAGFTNATVPPAQCKCPVSLFCEARVDKYIDCRTLVLEWNNWNKRQQKESMPEPPIDVLPEDEPFATLSEVQVITGLLDKVETRPRMSRALRMAFSMIQDWIRRMQSNSVAEDILTQSHALEHLKHFLSDDNSQLRREKQVPQSMIEDLTIIQRKWENGDLSVLACRGLRQTRNDGQWSADPNWQHARNADFLGHGLLVNGQTWHYRAEMCRDGAHGPPIAGISGTAQDGARSIVMGYHDNVKKEYYADIDQGDKIWYLGTALPRGENDKRPTNLKDPTVVGLRRQRITPGSKGQGPTASTRAMVTSYRTGNPVRVFRSFRLAKIVPMRPPRGFRYDGLYTVTDFEILNTERQIYRFVLERLATGQGPLRENLAPPKPEARKRKRE
ncbi:hypothetical protein A1O1_00853 [Capronia coronata CBS 617.96]|uniref:YDG domain-containing protein n=1 Tax=Capronia coronata CBS 617.96 TaxID=1182541 RepID=W9ZMJ6_9EURO|nr:uncharacterized protein A1O1_00853 [Capronia coronata CBS 617.96]EXJ95729.1 hypothetical protein A1O1_00853 [Capronia coronata CBS 617.96]